MRDYFVDIPAKRKECLIMRDSLQTKIKNDLNVQNFAPKIEKDTGENLDEYAANITAGWCLGCRRHKKDCQIEKIL